MTAGVDSAARAPVVTFLSDYGHLDEFVGVCHGVIVRRCPRARVIDITHAIPRHDIRAGAIVLADALPYMPPGVHLAVVDPQVGAVGEQARRAIAARTVDGERVLIGPDNGLLMAAAERFGGIAEAVDIGHSRERLDPVSHTFHGRDVFAPVAGALAAGTALADLGRPLKAPQLRPLELPTAKLRKGTLSAHVLRSDHFGNLVLDASAKQLAALGTRPGEELAVALGGRIARARHVSTFAAVAPGELLVYIDATGRAAVAVNRGSAAERLGGAAPGDELVLSIR